MNTEENKNKSLPSSNKAKPATEEYDPNTTSERHRDRKCRVSKRTRSKDVDLQSDVSNKTAELSNSNVAPSNMNASNYDWIDENSYRNRASDLNSAFLNVPSDYGGSRCGQSLRLSPTAPTTTTDCEQRRRGDRAVTTRPVRKSEAVDERSDENDVDRDRPGAAAERANGNEDRVAPAGGRCATRGERERRDGDSCAGNGTRPRGPRLEDRRRRRRVDDTGNWDPNAGSYSGFESSSVLGCRPRPRAERETTDERPKSPERTTGVDRVDRNDDDDDDYAKNRRRRRGVCGKDDDAGENWDRDVRGSYPDFVHCRTSVRDVQRPREVDERPESRRRRSADRDDNDDDDDDNTVVTRRRGRVGGKYEKRDGTQSGGDEDAKTRRRQRVCEKDVDGGENWDPDVGTYSEFENRIRRGPGPGLATSERKRRRPRSDDSSGGGGGSSEWSDEIDFKRRPDDDDDDDDWEEKEDPRHTACSAKAPRTGDATSTSDRSMVRFEDGTMPSKMLQSTANDDMGWSTMGNVSYDSSNSLLEDVTMPRVTDSFDLWDSQQHADEDQDVPNHGYGSPQLEDSFPDIRDTSMPRNSYEELHDSDNDDVCYCVKNSRQGNSDKDRKCN